MNTRHRSASAPQPCSQALPPSCSSLAHFWCYLLDGQARFPFCILVEMLTAWRIIYFLEATSLPQLQSIPILLPFLVLLPPRPPPRRNPPQKHIDIPHQALHPCPMLLHLPTAKALLTPTTQLLGKHMPASIPTACSLKTANTAKSAKSWPTAPTRPRSAGKFTSKIAFTATSRKLTKLPRQHDTKPSQGSSLSQCMPP